jgi:hypothetical protein
VNTSAPHSNVSSIIGTVKQPPKVVFDTQGNIFAMIILDIPSPSNDGRPISIPALFKNTVALKVESKIIVGDVMHLDGGLGPGLPFLTDSTLMIYVDHIVDVKMSPRTPQKIVPERFGTSLSPHGFFA